MALHSDTAALLAGFEKRMKFINIVRFLLEYKYPDSIKAMIPDKKILDNLILAVLVYIKERTLGSEQTCCISDVEHFLEDLSCILPESCQIDAHALAQYIIVEVLQSGGVMNEFLTFDSASETFKLMPVRILNEEKGTYHLTDDAFDFLFRSKEIESELDYSVTRFKMQEYMKRNNYENALDASRELVNRILQMKTSMNDFMLRCRENLANITADQYETVIGRIRSLLEDEYQQLQEIQSTAEQRELLLEQALESGLGNEDTMRQRAALREIVHNIQRTIEEQRALINKKTKFSQSYEELIRDNFVFNRFERLSFEKDILSPLRKNGTPLGDAAKFLLFTLTKPRLENQFSIENFYAPQSKLSQQEEDAGVELLPDEAEEDLKTETRNQRNLNIVTEFFTFASGRQHFALSEFIQSLSMAQLVFLCEENALPSVLLSICSLQQLDLEGWKKAEQFHVVPNGEFELAWCLTELPPSLISMQKINFKRKDSAFIFSAQFNQIQHRIEMSDFEVEVIA